MQLSNPIRRLAIAVSTVLAAISFSINPALGQALPPVQDSPDGPFYMPGEILIQFKATASDDQLKQALQQGALKVLRHIVTDAMRDAGQIGLTHAVTALPVEQVINALKHLPAIEFIQP